MNIERRITFVIGKEGLATWKLNRLKALSSIFSAIVILQNITTAMSSSAEHCLKAMGLGCKENDLCQLWIKGADAELACMVLTSFVIEEFYLISTPHKRKRYPPDPDIEKHVTFRLPFSMNYSSEVLANSELLDKTMLIDRLSRALDRRMAPVLLTSMLKREAISSTSIGNGIAIPHIMQEGIDAPAIAVIRLDKRIAWGGNLGDVCIVIALLIPACATLEVVKAFTQLTRSLLDITTCELLTNTAESVAIKAIIFHLMAKHKVV